MVLVVITDARIVPVSADDLGRAVGAAVVDDQQFPMGVVWARTLSIASAIRPSRSRAAMMTETRGDAAVSRGDRRRGRPRG
jgi:hypothetical protein